MASERARCEARWAATVQVVNGELIVGMGHMHLRDDGAQQWARWWEAAGRRLTRGARSLRTAAFNHNELTASGAECVLRALFRSMGVAKSVKLFGNELGRSAPGALESLTQTELVPAFRAGMKELQPGHSMC